MERRVKNKHCEASVSVQMLSCGDKRSQLSQQPPLLLHNTSKYLQTRLQKWSTNGKTQLHTTVASRRLVHTAAARRWYMKDLFQCCWCLGTSKKKKKKNSSWGYYSSSSDDITDLKETTETFSTLKLLSGTVMDFRWGRPTRGRERESKRR